MRSGVAPSVRYSLSNVRLHFETNLDGKDS